MADAIRKFLTDEETGAIKLQFLDADTGLDIPLTELLDYNILAENGLGQLAPVNAGIAPSIDQIPTDNPLGPQKPIELPQKGSDGNQGRFGDGAPRQASNNFGYVDKPGILGAAKFAGPLAGMAGLTGLAGPLGAVGVAARVAGTMINSNNALATSAARQSMGLAGLTGPQIGMQTLSDNQGQVADVNANGQTYSVGLEAETPDGRTTLTPSEARRRALGDVTEATPEQTKENVSQFNKDTGTQSRGMLGKIADNVLGRTPEAPQATITPTVSNPLSTTTTGPVATSAASQLGINATGKGLLGDPKRSVPSFNEVSSAANSPSIPASPASAFPGYGKETSLNQTPNVPGLAGISKSFKAGTYGTIADTDRTNLDPDIGKVLDNIGEKVGMNVGINSGYRDPGKNASVGGAKSSQHIQGKAVDVNTTGWSDDQKAAALDAAATAGAKGVGIYSSGNSLHLDTRKDFGTWGAGKNAYGGVSIDDQPGWAQDTLHAIQDAGQFNPGPRYGPIAQDKPANQIADNPTTTQGLASLVDQDISNQTVGRLQNAGFAPNYTDQEKTTMAVGLAGELGPKTLQGVLDGDPKSLEEAASVASVMSNRMAEKGVAGVRDPSQFNAFSTSVNPLNGNVPADTTKANFEKYGGALMGVVNDAVSGRIQSPTPDATHYANYDVEGVDKSWQGATTGVAKVGQHTFGTIKGEFDQKKSAAAQEQEARAKQAVANFAGYSGAAFKDQKADRKATDVTGLAKVSTSTPAKKETKNPEQAANKKAEAKKPDSSKTSTGPSSRGSGGNTTTGSGGMGGVKSKGSDGGVGGKSTASASGDGGGGKAKSSDSKSKSDKK